MGTSCPFPSQRQGKIPAACVTKKSGSGLRRKISRLRGGYRHTLIRSRCPRNLGALNKRLKLLVHDVRRHVHRTCCGRETAIYARNDILFADQARVVQETLGNKAWMFNMRCGGVNHARHDDLAFRPLCRLEHLPLMAMAPM